MTDQLSNSRRRVSLVALVAVFAGVVLGVASRSTDYMSEIPRWIGILGAPWLIVAFALGAYAGHRRLGATAGALALFVGCGTYYLVMWKVEQNAGFHYAFYVGVAWGIVALFAGAAFGLAGAAWRRGSERSANHAIVLLSGMLAGEAIYGAMAWSGQAAQTVVTYEAIAAAVVVLAMSRSSRLTNAVTAVAAAIALFAAETITTDAMHVLGWAGT